MRVLDDSLHGVASPAKVASARRHAKRYPSSRRTNRAREPESVVPLPKEGLVNRPFIKNHPDVQNHTELINAYKCLVYNWVTGPHERCIESTVPDARQ